MDRRTAFHPSLRRVDEAEHLLPNARLGFRCFEIGIKSQRAIQKAPNLFISEVQKYKRALSLFLTNRPKSLINTGPGCRIRAGDLSITKGVRVLPFGEGRKKTLSSVRVDLFLGVGDEVAFLGL